MSLHTTRPSRPFRLPSLLRCGYRSPVVTERLRRQGLSRPIHRTPEEVVAWFGAMQAQEYEPATWAIGLRMKGDPVSTDVERAVDDGRVVRTHVMRPTWHFVSRADIRWLLQLTAPRVHQAMSGYRRKLELDARVLVRCCTLFERALDGRRFLLRAELAERLARAKLPMTGVRLAMAVMYAELEGVICSGPRRDRKFTYANLGDRAPSAAPFDRDQALAELFTLWDRLPEAVKAGFLATARALATEVPR